MTDAPERVWLQDIGEWSGDAYMKGDLTWRDIEIDKNDTEYIRADLHQAALDRAVKADADLADMRLELLSALGEAGANLDRAVKAEAECERLRAALDIAEAQAVEMATDADGILWSDKAAELQGHVRGSEHIIEVWRSRCQKAEAECKRLRVHLSHVVGAWDWWRVNEYDRCQSVPADAIESARAALEGK